jgi:glycosyltransferase involved in cell wall biosynthesis
MTRELPITSGMMEGSPSRDSALAVPKQWKLLLVGPKPPPIGGSPLTVQAMLAEFATYPNLNVTLINTSPGMDIRREMTGFNLEKVRRALAILPAFMGRIPFQDAALVFSNDLFTITLLPVLRFVAWVFGKPFYVKPVAASLDKFIERLNPFLRGYLLAVLRSCDGILAQTKIMTEGLTRLGCSNVNYLPGCRPNKDELEKVDFLQYPLRLVYMGHITRRKGILVFMEALSRLKSEEDLAIACDFYGPVHDEIRREFEKKLSSIPSASYRGEVEPGVSTQTISRYHVLVLPTYFDTEGHPGVIIEAMHAGVPVISTRIRSLPELITDGENGILVPPQDPGALADAIRTLASDRSLAEKMGDASHARGAEFASDVVTARLLGIVLPSMSVRSFEAPETAG